MKIASLILLCISISAAIKNYQNSNESIDNDPEIVTGDAIEEEEDEPMDWWKQILQDKPKKTYFYKTGLWPCEQYMFDDSYQIRTRLETALTSDYFENQEFPVHHAVFTFTVMDEGESVPLVNMPVEFKATKSRRAVYVIEKDKLKKIHFGPVSSQTVWTNNNGQIRLSFKIKKDSDLMMQSFLFKTLNDNEWKLFRVDTDTLLSLSRVNEASLFLINPDLTFDTAHFLKTKLSLLFGFAAKQQASWYQPNHGFMTEGFSKSMKDLSAESVNQSWLNVKTSILNGIEILGNAADELKKLVVNIAKFAVYTLAHAISFAAEILKCVGLTLKAVVDSVKYVINWDAVVRTQVATYQFLNLGQTNIVELLHRKQDKVVALLKSFREKGTFKLSKLLETVQVGQEHEGSISQGYAKGARYGFTLDISTAMAKNADIEITNPAKSVLAKHLHDVEQALPRSKRSDAAYQSIRDTRNHVFSSKSGSSVLSTLLKTVRFLFKYLSMFVETSLNATLICMGLLIQLVWFILTIPLKIPVFHSLYRMLISNYQYEPTLLSLLTLGPSIVFTYGYMWSHDLYEPFPEFPVIPDYGYPDNWKEEKHVRLYKRGNSIQSRTVPPGRSVIANLLAIEALMIAYMITYLVFYGLIALLLTGPIAFVLILYYLLF